MVQGKTGDMGMLRKLAVTIRIAVVATIAALAASAQNHYIVRLSAGNNINTVASRHAMQVVTSLSGSASGLYVLNSPLPSSQALGILGADPAVVHTEADASIALPEVAKGAVVPSAVSQIS